MAKKKDKKSNKAKIASMVRKAQGGFAKSSIYREFGDYDPKDVDQRNSVSFRGSDILKSTKTPDQWAGELRFKGGKNVGDTFRKNGKIYKIATGHRGSIVSEEVVV